MSDDRAERRRRNRADAKAQRAKEIEEWEIERDWEIDPSWKAYVTHVREELAPMVWNSGMSLSIVPKRPQDVDVKFAVELGLSIMFSKPLIFCVPSASTEIPPGLRRLSDEIIVGDPGDPAVREQLMAAIERVGSMLDGDA